MGKYENWFVGQPWYDGNDPHYNKDGNSLSDWFGDKRHFRPWYDDDSDYNTNAKSYYDYIAYRTRQLDYIIQAINKLLDRNLQVEDTNTIDLEKIGEWLNKDDTETIKAYVKVSKQTLNATQALEDGIYTKNLQPDIDRLSSELEKTRADLQAKIDKLASDLEKLRGDLSSKLNNLQEQLKQLQRSVSINGKIEVPRAIDITHSSNLAKGVELGKVTDSTRISIVAILGSTRVNSIFTVGELKNNASHVFLFNANDFNDGISLCEGFTKIIGNKLYCTTVHNYEMSVHGGLRQVHKPWREPNDGSTNDKNNTPYLDDVDPEYLAGTGRTRDLIFQSVTVYDQVDPITVS